MDSISPQMLIPLADLQHPSNNFRNHNASTNILTKMIAYKRSLLFTIAILGILHYFHSSPHNIDTASVVSNHYDNIQEIDTSSFYLYRSEEAHPHVFDYNPIDYNFQTLNSPKVVEFYDPKCGACQAFKYNYIEVAKKIKEEKSNVQFYGVSCQVYRSVCDEFDVKRFPKILVFPESKGEVKKEDGIEVPKGTGTIYFLSARLIKALRTKEEIEKDRINSSRIGAQS